MCQRVPLSWIRPLATFRSGILFPCHKILPRKWLNIYWNCLIFVFEISVCSFQNIVSYTTVPYKFIKQTCKTHTYHIRVHPNSHRTAHDHRKPVAMVRSAASSNKEIHRRHMILKCEWKKHLKLTLSSCLNLLEKTSIFSISAEDEVLFPMPSNNMIRFLNLTWLLRIYGKSVLRIIGIFRKHEMTHASSVLPTEFRPLF